MPIYPLRGKKAPLEPCIEVGPNPSLKLKKKRHHVVSLLFLAEDEGFEPPQTESESGVLPLHKSSILYLVETTGLEPVTSCV